MASEARVRATYHAAVDEALLPALLASIRALCTGEATLNLRESTYREPAFAEKCKLAEEQQKEQAAKERDDRALEQDEKVHNATRVVSETNQGGSQRPPPQGGYKRAREKTLKAAESAALARQKLETEAAAAAECCVLRSDGVEECVLRIPAPTKENLKGVSRRAGVRARKETLVAAGANAAAFLEAAFGFELQHELVRRGHAFHGGLGGRAHVHVFQVCRWADAAAAASLEVLSPLWAVEVIASATGPDATSEAVRAVEAWIDVLEEHAFKPPAETDAPSGAWADAERIRARLAKAMRSGSAPSRSNSGA